MPKPIRKRVPGKLSVTRRVKHPVRRIYVDDHDNVIRVEESWEWAELASHHCRPGLAEYVIRESAERTPFYDVATPNK